MNPAQDHPNREKLAAFLRGQLSLVDQAAIESHIAECAPCCQILQEIPDDAFLGRLRGATPLPESNNKTAVGPIRVRTMPDELRDHPRYKVGRFLGAGGMGVVYQAEHRLMERAVALKIIHGDLMQHPKVVERFRLEVKAAARLAHSNIVTAHDAEQAGKIHFLVMEYVDGISLNRLVERRGPLGVAHACNYAAQAAKGLQHAFENGMVHRDIKPHNLMLTRKGQVKILDFGLARLASEVSAETLPLSPPSEKATSPGLTMTGDIMGTPEYMAPEQAFDPREADIRADIYSLGCTLYYLLVGQPPYAQGSVLTKLMSRPRPVTELRGDLPAGLVAILNRMMAKDPADRYQTPAEVAKALTPFGKSISGQTKKPETPEKPASGQELVAVPALAAKPAEAAKEVSPVFLARCPFCPTRIRVPNKGQGASILCPQCGSYFTAVPEEDAANSPNPGRPWIK